MENYINTVDPCCGSVPLKTGVKFIAIIDMVNCIATGIFVAFLLLITVFYADDFKIAVDKDRAEFPDEVATYDYIGNGLAMWIFVLMLVLSVLYFLLAQSLLHGAQQKDSQKIARWIHVTLMLLAIRLICLLFGILLATDSFGFLFFVFIHTMYVIYCLWVVYRFQRELMTEESIVLRHRHNISFKL